MQLTRGAVVPTVVFTSSSNQPTSGRRNERLSAEMASHASRNLEVSNQWAVGLQIVRAVLTLASFNERGAAR